MTPDVLIKRLLAQREFSVEVAAGKQIRLRRPAEMDVMGMIQRGDDGKVVGLAADLADVKRFAVGWEGIAELDLVPSGASDPVPFDADLFAVLIEDRRDWCAKCCQALVDKVLDHEGLQREARGN